MFCKYCGKEISDDSIYCKHCGTLQDPQDIDGFNKGTTDLNDTETTSPLNTFWYKWYKSHTKSQLVLFWLYVIWFIVNMVLLASGDKDYDGKGFFPFGDRYYEWDVRTYGLQEFIIYAILLPLIMYLIDIISQKDNNKYNKQPTTKTKIKEINYIDPYRPTIILTTVVTVIVSIMLLIGLALIISGLIHIN